MKLRPVSAVPFSNRFAFSGWCAPIAALLLATSAPAAAEAPEDVDFRPDIVYGRVGEEDLKLNLSIPAEASGKLPCLLIIHGGGWAGGDRAQHNDLTWLYARQGYVCATLGYRLVPRHIFPAQVEDVKCAVRFLRANAEKFHIDPERIGAAGFSAGAHLAMMLGVMDAGDGLDASGGSEGFSSKVQAVVAFFGPTDFSLELPEKARPLYEGFLGGKIADRSDAYRLASPVTYVSKGDAPMLLFQGTADPLVPYGQAVKMAEAMQKAGVPGRVELLVGADHGWGGAELHRSAAVTHAFLAEHLKDGGN